MNDRQFIGSHILKVVLTDANVLFSRVLRDYLLYAAEYRLIAVAWSHEILSETVNNLMENRRNFTRESADRLITAMTKTFPFAEINPEPDHFSRIAHLTLPDEGDRHVIAAALAAEADIICTNNTRDFPSDTVGELGLTVATPDELICRLIGEFPSIYAIRTRDLSCQPSWSHRPGYAVSASQSRGSQGGFSHGKPAAYRRLVVPPAVPISIPTCRSPRRH